MPDTGEKRTLLSPTEGAIWFVQRRYGMSRKWTENYFEMLGRNLICWTCGSENHTEGHTLCWGASGSPEGGAT